MQRCFTTVPASAAACGWATAAARGSICIEHPLLCGGARWHGICLPLSPPRGPARRHTTFGGAAGVVVNCFLVFLYAGSGKSLAYGSDDGAAMGIIFLVEGITMIVDLNLQD